MSPIQVHADLNGAPNKCINRELHRNIPDNPLMIFVSSGGGTSSACPRRA
jgi:hypothetical protein